MVTAFTPKVDPFYDYGRLALLQGKCTVFANVAEFGGSKVFARAENTGLWFVDADGTKPIPRRSEAVLVVEADLEKQFEIRKSVTEQRAVTDVRLFPIVYPAESPEAKHYSEILELCAATKPTPAEIASQISSFTALNSRVFPELMREKLSHFTGYIAGAGTLSAQEALRWVTPVTVRDIRSTDGLRWELCNQAADVVHKLLSSAKYVHKSKELSDVYVHLLEARNELAGSIEPRTEEAIGPDTVKVTARPATTESPFIDRDSAFDKIRQFFAQQQSSILILGGMRGIGKSAFVQESFRQAIPLRKRIWLQLTEGVSYHRLLAELAFGCNLQLPDDLDLSAIETQEEVKKRILTHLRLGPGTVIVFDEFQFLLSPSAEIEDPRLRDLLLGLAEAGQRGKTKYFFVSHVFPRLGPDFESHSMSYSLSGLQPPDTRRLLLHWVQFTRDDLHQGRLPTPSERLITVLGGHPLATKVAARLWAEHPMADVAEEISIFKELRDTIVTFVLEKLTLSPEERELLAFASVFRLPAPREVFLKWRREDASRLLSSLAGHYLIESSERGYQLHPLVRSFFSHGILQESLRAWHKIAAKFYLQEFERLKTASKQIVPEYLGEAVHHFLAAGDRQRVKAFAFYAQELRPVALDHYRAGDLKVAMKDYQVLLEIDPNDLDAHFHLSLIFAREERWGDAEFHFGKAISLRPRAPWILQAFGAAKIRAGKIADGEELLLQAERAAPNHSPTLVELGRLRESQGDKVAAETYFRKAIQSDPDNAFAYYQLSRLLYKDGDAEQALEMAKAALVCNPMNERNKALVSELRKKIADATPAPAPRQVRISVQVRCVETNTQAGAITAIGGINSDGKHWRLTVSDAITHIEKKKYVFYVQAPDGETLDLLIARSKSGDKHLTTSLGDAALLSLPHCQ